MPLSCVAHHHHTYTYLSCAAPSVHPAYDPSSSDILFSRKCLVSIPNPLKRGGGYRHSRYHPLAKKHLTGAASQLCTVLCSQIQIWGRLYLYFYGSSHSLSTDTSLSHISLELSESALVTDCREIRGERLKVCNDLHQRALMSDGVRVQCTHVSCEGHWGG